MTAFEGKHIIVSFKGLGGGLARIVSYRSMSSILIIVLLYLYHLFRIWSAAGDRPGSGRHGMDVSI